MTAPKTSPHLRQEDVVSYLVEAQLLSAREIVDDGVSVLDRARRNLNFQVLGPSGRGYVVKQGIGAERRATVAHEAAVYAILHSAAGGLCRYLPTVFRYDEADRILVLELRPQAQSLREYYARRGPFSRTLAARLGDALGELHRLTGSDRAAPVAAPPWVLGLHHCGVEAFRDLSAGNVELIKIIQQFPSLYERLDGMRETWSARALVHNDVRWDNCVAAPRAGSGRMTELYMIDWELAGLGDPAWDVGSVFAGYLSLWLLSIAIADQAAPEDLAGLARWPLDRMQPALRRFWGRYVRGRGFAADAAEQALLEATRHAAVRLLQIVVEQTQTAVEPSPVAILALQLGENMLERPREAAETLLGIGAAHS